MTKNLGGRPVVHGLKVITGNRIRKARLAFAAGKSRRKVSSEIFKLSPRTFKRYLELDDPRSRALRQAVDEGERLKGEPLAPLICMLIDQRDQLCEEQGHMRYHLPQNIEDVDYSKIEVSEEDEGSYVDLMRHISALNERLKRALSDNDELKKYIGIDGRKGDDLLLNRSEDHDYVKLEKLTDELGIEPLEVDDYESHRSSHKLEEDNKVLDP